MNREQMTIKLDVHPGVALLMSISLSMKPDIITDKGYKILNDIAQQITYQAADHVAVYGQPDFDGTDLLNVEEFNQ